MPIALITGTSTGIGLETALLFARRGYDVFASARSPAASEGLQRAVDGGLPVTPIVLDVDTDESVRDAVARLGPVDVLVNNAGIGSAAAVEHMPLAEIREMFETNVFGAMRVMQAVLPGMRERRRGVIVNVTSMMGRLTLPCHGAYAATKFALAALSETLAMEMRPFGVRVAIVEPGVVLTPIWGKRTVTMPEGHEYGPAMTRLLRIFESQMEGGTLPDVVAQAIYDAVTDEDAPVRIPVGEDAEVLAAARDRVTTDEWVSMLTEPDENAFAARFEQMAGVDLLHPPSLNARRTAALRLAKS
jgi:NAD(P)-dependent dehydrogenase (short-subunit alcohol dehydrogenase family)